MNTIKNDYVYDNEHIGGFAPNDGTIDFYLRVRSLCSNSSVVLDFGAGRAGWFKDDQSETRKLVRFLKKDVKLLIAVDIDHAVLQNEASHKNCLMIDGVINLPDKSVDLIIADYVFEHITNISDILVELERILKPGGWICARTPHRLHYVAVAARLLNLIKGSEIIRYFQPNRKDMDIFPTYYRLNSLKHIKSFFPGWRDMSLIFRSNPSYYLGDKLIYRAMSIIHRLLPSLLIGNIFVFLQKPFDEGDQYEK